MRVHLDNTPENTQTPQVIARKIRTKFYKLKQNEDRRNLQLFNTNKTSEQGTNTNIHGYAHSRMVNNQNRSTTESYTSPPLPNYPPPVRPPPPSDYITEHPRTQTHVQQRLFTSTANSRPNNLRFPYAVTRRSTNSKSFFHQSTNEQTPTATVMETIWFQDKDPRTLNSPHSSNYNPLLSYRNWANMPFDSREYNFFMSPLHNLKDRVSEYFLPLPPENTNTVKRSTKNMGRDKLHQTMYPKLKQFYSLTERFLYDYDYEFKIPITCNFDLLVAKASQDLSAYSIYDHQIFQLSFNFLHLTPKDVQNNNYRVHETKLIHNLLYYTFLRDKNDNTSRSYIHINDQLTSPYFLNYGYRLKWEYTLGTLRNFDPIKNYYIFQPKDAPERPLMVPLEALEPCEEYHVYHLEGAIANRAFTNRINFNNDRTKTELEQELCNTVKASITDIPLKDITNLIAYFLSKDDKFVKEYRHYKERTNQPKQTEKL